MRDTSRPTVQNSLQPRPAAAGPPVAGRVPADGAPPLCGGGLGGDDGQGRWGRGAQSLLGVRLEFPPRATGAGVSQRSWATGPDLALRREARGLLVEVMEAQASCGGPGTTPPGRATNMLSVLFTLPHRPEPPSGPNRPRAQRGGAFVPWMFAGPFPSAESSPPPLSSRKSCAFPTSRAEAGKGAETPLWLSFLSRNSKNPRRLATGSYLDSRGGAGSAFLVPLLPTWSLHSPPPPRPGRESRREERGSGAAGLSPGMWRRGMCMQMGPARGGAAGRARAGRMLIVCK